jgi:hypothetical protein
MAEHVSFRFDWDEVAHERVTNVLGLDATIMDDGSARWMPLQFASIPRLLW